MNFPQNFGHIQPSTCIYPSDLGFIQSLDPAQLLAMTSAIANQVDLCQSLSLQSTDITSNKPAQSAYLASSSQYDNIASVSVSHFPNIAQCLSTPSTLVNNHFTNQDGSRGRFRPHSSSVNPTFYCDLCKISCIGPSAFNDHQSGQRHKKRLSRLGASEKPQKPCVTTSEQSSSVATGLYTQLRCELCEIVCNGVDSYAAHLGGRQHRRAVRLCRELGKPIPDTNNPLVPSALADMINERENKPVHQISNPSCYKGGTSVPVVEQNQMRRVELKRLLGAEIPLVGQEYIQTVNNGIGKAVSYRCRLCECDFTNANARTLHLRGRRHRLQYKAKVDPSYPVEIKPNYHQQQQQERQNNLNQKSSQNEIELMRATTEKSSTSAAPTHSSVTSTPTDVSSSSRIATVDSSIGRTPTTSPASLPCFAPNYGPSNLLNENRYVTLKHSTIIPTPSESKAMMMSVNVCERALKLISNNLLKEVRSNPTTNDSMESNCLITNSVTKSSDEQTLERLLCGAVRVNALGKNLLLRGEHNADLVLICSHWPTKELLNFVSSSLVGTLVSLDARFEYEVTPDYNSGSIVVTILCTDPTTLQQTDSGVTPVISKHTHVDQSITTDWPVITLFIYLTSPTVFTETKQKSDTQLSISSAGPVCESPCDLLNTKSTTSGVPDMFQRLITNGEKLPKSVCVRALDILDQTNWFQVVSARGAMLMVSRILRAFFQSNILWSNLNQFDVEVHLEQLLTSERQSNHRPNPFVPYRTSNTMGFVPSVCAQFGQARLSSSSSSSSSSPILNDMFSPVKLLRRFFESFASGYLLALISHRSCNNQADTNDIVDVNSPRRNGINNNSRIPFSQSFSDGLTLEMCEEITLSAQYIVRQIAFKQLYKVLGMRKLTTTNNSNNNSNDTIDNDNLKTAIHIDTHQPAKCEELSIDSRDDLEKQVNDTSNYSVHNKRKLNAELDKLENVNDLSVNNLRKQTDLIISDFPVFKSAKTTQ